MKLSGKELNVIIERFASMDHLLDKMIELDQKIDDIESQLFRIKDNIDNFGKQLSEQSRQVNDININVETILKGSYKNQ